jgi:tetratricopeptide (TPR) repeat protein
LFTEAKAFARKMLAAHQDLQPFDLVYAHTALGFVLMVLGDFKAALGASVRALEIADQNDIPFLVPPVASQVGWLLAMRNRVDEGLKTALRAVHAAESTGAYAGRSRWSARLSEVCLIAGDIVEARRHIENAIAIAQNAGEQGYLCSALRLRGKILSQSGNDLDGARADIKRAISIARRLAVGPTIAKCLLDLGRLERIVGGTAAARQDISAAANGFRRYKMRSWGRHARQELALLSPAEIR